MRKNKFAIISLGGSLIVPDAIDYIFLRKFKQLIEQHIKQGWRFIIVTGGGKTARRYQEAAGKLVTLSDDDLDWLGIHSTRLNAHLMRTIFRKDAHPVMSKNPERKLRTKKPIIVGCGWKPGWSTDYVSVKMCETYGIDTILNLSNIDYVYSADPKKDRRAVKIPDITWHDFQKIVGTTWSPGANLPFDPIATKHAKRLGTNVYILGGKNIATIENVLAGKAYKGTFIHS